MTNLFNQKEILAYFSNSKKQNNLYRTCLFVSPSERLQLLVINEIVSFLLCKNPNGKACKICSSCKKIKDNIHPDVTLIKSKPIKGIPVADLRKIIQQSSTMPWESSYKIFILQNIDFLMQEGANTLLKVLEEPPDHLIFFLTAINKNEVINTILSRCQIFSLGEHENNSINEIMKQCNINQKEAQAVLNLNMGNFAEAQNLLKTNWKMRLDLVNTIINKLDPIEAGEKFSSLCGSGNEAKEKTLLLIQWLGSFWHDVLLYVYMQESAEKFVINKDFNTHIKKMAQSSSVLKINDFIQYLFEIRNMLIFNVNNSLIWENIFLKSSCILR